MSTMDLRERFGNVELRLLRQARDYDSAQAVSQWLLAGNRVTVVPTGQSGIWDENGQPRRAGKQITARTMTRLAKARMLFGQGRSHAEIIEVLGINEATYRSMIARWGMGQ